VGKELGGKFTGSKEHVKGKQSDRQAEISGALRENWVLRSQEVRGARRWQEVELGGSLHRI
jgi:hypothetical protein